MYLDDEDNDPIVVVEKSNVNFNMIFIINIVLGIAAIAFCVVSMQMNFLTNLFLLNNLPKLIVPFMFIGVFLIYYTYKRKIGDVKTHVKLFLWWFLVMIIIIVFNICNIINPSTKYGEMDYVTVENIEIPTLYKYTKYNDVFTTIYERNYNDGNIVSSYLIVFYKEKIPKGYINNYTNELIKLDYKKVIYDGNAFYVQNNPGDSSFQYIYIGELQIQYGVCTSGYYQDVLK